MKLNVYVRCSDLYKVSGEFSNGKNKAYLEFNYYENKEFNKEVFVDFSIINTSYQELDFIELINPNSHNENKKME